ncbi:MAG: twin-arginine translocase subunit TatC [Tannerella sp.]|jgi:sec-independent protein translocase protein TatC|nr:twin-arginine translocase subunit TatC [Tannerella sp.]
MSEHQEEMSFWDHLETLRWTLFRCVIALVVFTVGSFVFLKYQFDAVILAPCKSDFVLYKLMCKVTSSVAFLPDFCDESFKVDIVNIKLATQFFIHMSTSFWLAILLTFPYLMYEVWRFVSPALYTHEKRNVRWVFFFGTIMFFVGCAVGYFMVFPMTLRFLATYQLGEIIREQVSIESYMDTFFMMLFIMGIVFELPLLSWLLSQFGLITRSFFNRFRRHAIVILLIAAALITPSSDPFTLACVFFPLYGLYELSALFVKKKKIELDDDDDAEKTEITKYEAD